MNELTITFEELCGIHDTMLVMNIVDKNTKLTLLQEQTGIGSTLSVSVPIEHRGVKGDFVIDFTDVSKW